MRATYQFQNSPKLISNWGESLEKDLLLPVRHSNPAIGVVGKENIVLAVEKTVTDPRSATNILPLDNTGIILAYTGCVRDAPFLVKRVRVVIKYCEHLPIRPEYVARYVAGVRRQLDFYGRKPYSLLTLIVGFEPSTSSHELWVADPSGIVRKRLAQAIGRDFDLRNEFLRKNYDYQETSGQTAVKLAIRALLEVGESGEKKIEVTIITREHGPKPLKQAEIDAIIAEIEAEKIDELEAEKGASEKEAIIDELEAEKGASEKEAIIDELDAEKAASEKAAAEKERKKKAAAKKKKRKAKKLAAEAVKKTLPDKPLDDIIAADLAEMDTEPLDDIIAADLAEMDTERVEMAHVEGPEVDEIKAENATHTWISKIFSCLLFIGI